MMQNSAIESRTQLRLNTEIEEQKQLLADLKMNKEQERAKLSKKIKQLFQILTFYMIEYPLQFWMKDLSSSLNTILFKDSISTTTEVIHLKCGHKYKSQRAIIIL